MGVILMRVRLRDRKQRSITISPFVAYKIQTGADCCDGYNNLGVIYFERGQYHEAVLMFKRVLSLDPDNRLAGENLALVAPGNINGSPGSSIMASGGVP